METFLNVLDPDDTSTGGGSASALAGAMAGALLAMAAKLSSPGGDGQASAFFAGVYVQAVEVSKRLQEGGKEDAQAFLAVRSAYRLARLSEAERDMRQRAVQAAWLLAAQTPLENAQRCLRVLELGAELAGKVNPNVLSDFNCALLLARAGLQGCLENVTINLPSLKDSAWVERLSAQAAELRERCDQLSAA